jgi:hypothetical protein
MKSLEAAATGPGVRDSIKTDQQLIRIGERFTALLNARLKQAL